MIGLLIIVMCMIVFGMGYQTIVTDQGWGGNIGYAVVKHGLK